MRLGGSARDARELYKRHEGAVVWIVGSDPSLSEYPADFLEGKVGITLHLAHVKFPNATYRYSSEYDRSEHLAAADPSYREKPIIVGWPVYGKSPRETAELFAGFREVYAHGRRSYPPTGVRGEVDEAFTEWKVRRTKEGRASVWGAHGTCLHTAIYMAVLLGAGEIHVIGAGHGFYKPELEHFAEVEGEQHEMRPGYRSFSDPVEHVPLVEQTFALADACGEIGIGFVWHRTWTPAMDDIMKVDPSWLAEEKRRAVRRFSISRRIYWMLVKRPLNRIASRF
jgi:hypothetical protein